MPFCPGWHNGPSPERVVSLLNLGLTGGIGSGKSAVAALLRAHGAVINDLDQNARDVVGPGSEGLRKIVERFGDGVLLPDGSLNRPALSAAVFNGDDQARMDLNKITHPLIAQLSREQVQRAKDELGDQAIIITDSPLLFESKSERGFIAVIVVEAPTELRITRLAEGRGISEEEARKRIAVQVSDEHRRAGARWLIVNDGDLDALAAKVATVWDEVVALNAKVNELGLDPATPLPLDQPLPSQV